MTSASRPSALPNRIQRQGREERQERHGTGQEDLLPFRAFGRLPRRKLAASPFSPSRSTAFSSYRPWCAGDPSPRRRTHRAMREPPSMVRVSRASEDAKPRSTPFIRSGTRMARPPTRNVIERKRNVIDGKPNVIDGKSVVIERNADAIERNPNAIDGKPPSPRPPRVTPSAARETRPVA